MTCVWEPDPACLGTTWSSLSPEIRERSLMLASSALQDLTLGRVGTCPITIRPMPPRPLCGCGFNPHKGLDGQWRNNCPCRGVWPDEIDVPGPVGYIDEFKIDGLVQDLDGGDWRLDDGHLLVWQGDGPSPFPLPQDLSKPDTEVGTHSITYSRSYPVAADGRIAVAYLAMEFAEACKPKGKCSLPRGVSSVVRNGVSFTIEAGLFPNGLTGLQMVDPFILKWAPAGAPSQSATVFDPRSLRPRQTNAVPRKRVPTPAPVTEGSDE